MAVYGRIRAIDAGTCEGKLTAVLEVEKVRSRYANKTDANHGDIAEWLSLNGCDVVDCSRAGSVPDLLVKYPKSKDGRAMIGWLEVKVPTKREARFTWD